MSDLTRRRLLGTTLAGAGILAATRGAAAAPAQPAELFGSVEGGKIAFPPIHNASEVEGQPPNPDAPARRLGIAVVGLGRLSLENILPGIGQSKSVRLAGLVSGHRDKALAVADQYGLGHEHVYDYAGYDRIAGDAGIDAVYVVVPNALHEEYVVRAAAARKHVLCEKPMAASPAQCERMIAACRRANVKLMVAYRMQYEPANRTLVELVRAKRYGDVRFIEAVNGQNDAPDRQWRQIRALSGGGSLPDVGLYCLNAFRFITGEEPLEVTGRVTRPANDPRFAEVEDVCQFTLRFPSGIVATGSSGYSFHESRRLRVHAAAGWLDLDPAFSYDNVTLHLGAKAGDANAVDTRRFTQRSQFATEMDAFVDAVRANRTPHTPGEEGLQDHRIMAAIYASAADGGRAVRLPVITGIDTMRGPLPPASP